MGALVATAASPASAAEASGPGTYENDSPAIEYFGTWSTVTSIRDSGGSHNNSNAPTATASFTFSGPSVQWLSRKTAAGGINEVYVDDALVQTVDRYDPVGAFQQVMYRADDLGPGTHTIVVKATGTKNSAATGSTTTIDAFIVPEPALTTGLTGLPSATGPSLSWNATPSADGYRVYRSEGGGEPVLLTEPPVAEPSFVDTTASPATAYNYTVRSIVGDLEGPDSDAVTVASAAGPGVYENDHPAIRYSGTWSTPTSSNDSGGSFASSNSPTASASFSFTGSSIAWTSRLTGASGINDVYLDGTKVDTVDRYSATGKYQQTVFTNDELTDDMHTITIMATGTKNPDATGSQTIIDTFVVPDTRIVTGLTAAPAEGSVSLEWHPVPGATGYNIYRQPSGAADRSAPGVINGSPVGDVRYLDGAVEAGSVYTYSVAAIIDGSEAPAGMTAQVAAAAGVGTYENTHSAITYSGTWTTASSSNDSGGSYATSNSPTATASFTFTGTAIQWISRKTGASGINDVYLDGTKVASIDRYSATGKFQQVVYQNTSLTAGTHTITIKATGKKNASANGSMTILDAFVVPDTRIVKSLEGKATTSGISLTWEAVSNAAGYNVYRSSNGTASTPVNSAAVTAAKFTDTGVTAGIAYTYKVRAIVNGSEGPASDPVTVTTAAGPGTYENDHQAIRYTGTWTTPTSSNDSGGSYATSNSPAATASFTFTGTSIVWTSRRTGASGINDVYIDGTKVASIDRYSATGQYKVEVYRNTSLSAGVHTIMIKGTGTKNSAANGSSTIVDSFRVPKPEAPAKLSGVRAAAVDNGVTVSWKSSGDADVTGYKVYRGTATSGELSLIATVPASETEFINVDVKGTKTYRYYVRAVDYIGRLSPTWTSASVRVSAYAGYDYLGYDDCPAATVTATSTTTLKAALAAAEPGDVIRLRAGTYNNRFEISAKAPANNPIWICGSPQAILKGYGITGGNGFEIKDSTNIILSGMTVTESLKAVMVTRSSHITVSDVTVHTVGQEGIHLRQNTTDSIVAGNNVSKTGLVAPEYGEGIYIGLHPDNWCSQNDCEPDESDRNAIVDNTVFDTAAEAVDAKEGSSDGWIMGNTVDASGTTATSRWIVIRGNGWFVADNKGTGRNLTDGILVDAPPLPGYGTGNVIVRNTATMNSDGYAVRVNKQGNIVGCATNTFSGSARALTNVTCQK
ncbi:right-handed parallel beta-helix repeat-containing protein [Herbiconiux sp. KACC 21604]|uniref:right-handed parallel beta-helix repeat-containing protein n=1 Tax=unclassified Herbiconiux TaxID=2618217 RepID=UPI0014921233|nr:right-handed parallel beta-helix repeat-containing protein [Herbiconiux sp. SALV-R1]QJU54579.1 hypothetical protein HL652_13725 [Herbiconiux sp. SALV-R1]WPO85665.1 right-handed parallel beta-helix repeat-containing protein [Herbiconiux sp. KACC 21604]